MKFTVLILALLAICCSAYTAALDPLADLENLKDFQSMRSSSSDPDWRNGNDDARPIPAGGTLVIADLKGPGRIVHIWNTVAARDLGYSRLLVVRMYWDGEKNPSVECPLGDFFGMGHGLDVPFDSIPVRVSSEGKGRNCYWPMPFKKSAKITITNEGAQEVGAFFWYVDWQKLPALGDEVATFHCMYRQEYPAVKGRNYLIADIEGRGHYVGTVLSCREGSNWWWGEGDDFFFIDGEKEPSLRVTGTEDYFCDGWGFRKQAGPYYGAPLCEGQTIGCRTTVYRWHVPDPITFTKSLRFEIEHKGMDPGPDGQMSGFVERPDDYSSAAFWYQTEPHKAYPTMPKGYGRLYYDFSKAIEGESLVKVATATEGQITHQYEGGTSQGDMLVWRPTKPDQTLSMPIEIKESGDYEIYALFLFAPDYGVHRMMIDDKPVGQELNFWSGTVKDEERIFPKMHLEAGKHTLSFKCLGKNGNSGGFLLGFDMILFQKR
jgi:hypothetical protein